MTATALKRNGLHLTKDAKAINKMLLELNGKAKKHVFTKAADIRRFVDNVDQQTISDTLYLPKKHTTGVEVLIVSGDEMKASYKNDVIRNIVLLRLRAGGWYIVSIERIETPPNLSTKPSFFLSKDKDEKAVAGLRKNYTIGDGVIEKDRVLAKIEDKERSYQQWKIEQGPDYVPSAPKRYNKCIAMCGGYSGSTGGFCANCLELIADDDLPGHR